MTYQPSIRSIQGKDHIFCAWRRQFVRLTPEEWVRQHLLHYLVEELHYPMSLIAVEVPIEVGAVRKRCDAVIYRQDLTPVCIVEFKAESVTLSQKVLDQVAIYNRTLHTPYGIVSNGKQTFAYRIGDTNYDFLPSLPSFEQLCSNKS